MNVRKLIEQSTWIPDRWKQLDCNVIAVSTTTKGPFVVMGMISGNPPASSWMVDQFSDCVGVKQFNIETHIAKKLAVALTHKFDTPWLIQFDSPVARLEPILRQSSNIPHSWIGATFLAFDYRGCYLLKETSPDDEKGLIDLNGNHVRMAHFELEQPEILQMHNALLDLHRSEIWDLPTKAAAKELAIQKSGFSSCFVVKVSRRVHMAHRDGRMLVGRLVAVREADSERVRLVNILATTPSIQVHNTHWLAERRLCEEPVLEVQKITDVTPVDYKWLIQHIEEQYAIDNTDN